MPSQKNQHFVPQFYLRSFFPDGKRVAVYKSSDGRLLSAAAPIRGQCASDYMYGKETGVENNLSKLESTVQGIVASIVAKSALPHDSPENRDLLYFWILYQHLRTEKSARALNFQVNEFTSALFKEWMKAEDFPFPPEKMATLRVKYQQPALLNLELADQMRPLVRDLGCHLLVTRQGDEFVTSDQPVVLYNRVFRNSFKNHLGWASKGLIVVYPVSPKHCVVLADESLYQVPDARVRKVQGSLVDEVNILQIINSDECIYSLGLNESRLSKLALVASRFRTQKPYKVEKISVTMVDGTRVDDVLHGSTSRIAFPVSTDLFKTKKRIPEHYRLDMVARDPFLVQLHQRFMNAIDEGKYSAADWNAFLKSQGI